MSLYRLSLRFANNLSNDIKINIGLKSIDQIVPGGYSQTHRNFSALQKKHVSKIESIIKETLFDYAWSQNSIRSVLRECISWFVNGVAFYFGENCMF